VDILSNVVIAIQPVARDRRRREAVDMTVVELTPRASAAPAKHSLTGQGSPLTLVSPTGHNGATIAADGVGGGIVAKLERRSFFFAPIASHS
jgi:hypothetical protein